MSKAVNKRQTVLICDDEADILTVFTEVLESEFVVLTADSGEECIRKVNEQKRKGNRIDIVLLDYKLGDMLGDEVATKLRALVNSKIVLITAYELEDKTIEQMKKSGLIVDRIKKPISISELLPRLKSI